MKIVLSIDTETCEMKCRADDQEIEICDFRCSSYEMYDGENDCKVPAIDIGMVEAKMEGEMSIVKTYSTCKVGKAATALASENTGFSATKVPGKVSSCFENKTNLQQLVNKIFKS